METWLDEDRCALLERLLQNVTFPAQKEPDNFDHFASVVNQVLYECGLGNGWTWVLGGELFVATWSAEGAARLASDGTQLFYAVRVEAHFNPRIDIRKEVARLRVARKKFLKAWEMTHNSATNLATSIAFVVGESGG